MERRASDSEKRNSQIKLPAINHRKGDSSRVLSNTMPDNCRVRPSSMHKVEDLQKKLFDKLESYQNPSRKTIKRGTKKKIEGENSVQPQIEGFQRIQKLMPGLFTKLVQVKKSANLEPPTQRQSEWVNLQQKGKNTVEPKGKTTSSVQHKRRKTETKPSEAERQSREANNEIEMSLQQYEQVYRQYSRREQLGPETSGEELAAMGQSLLVCEKEIQKLTKSMEGLIRQLGTQCIVDFESDEQIQPM